MADRLYQGQVDLGANLGRRTPGYTQTFNTNTGGGWGGGSSVTSSPVAPEAMSAMDKAIAYYAPGGGFGKGTEAALGRAETKAVASGMQNLVGAGLANTTMAGGLGKKFQEEVGMPMRARVEETRAQALSGLEMTKAQIIQGATESKRASALQEYLAQLSQSSGGGVSGPTVTSRGGGTPATTAVTPAAGTAKAAYKFPSAPSLIPSSYKPSRYEGMTNQEMIAAGGVTIT